MAAGFDLDRLMHDLAQRKSGRAKFVETRYLAVLDKPLIASGELAYTAPDRLEKLTRTPKPELLRLDKEALTLERERKKITIDLGQYPQAQAFVDSIRGTLAGDRRALERHYLLRLNGGAEAWTLTLLPNDQQIAGFVQRIDIAGKGNRVLGIEYRQTDGDRTVMTIEPMDTP